MASKHYPGANVPSDAIRHQAADILWELRESGPEGLTTAEVDEIAGNSWTKHRAIEWLRASGIVVEYSKHTMRWTLGDGPDRLPAHALSRLDLLDELRDLLGPDKDPLDAIRELRREAGDRWDWRFGGSIHSSARMCWIRVAHGLEWLLEYKGHTATLTARRVVPGFGVDHCAVFTASRREGIGESHEQVKAHADYVIAGLRERAPSILASLGGEPQEETAWW